ncbi:condensation domain-containing protein, partial [Streptomyces sp. NPDC059071]|uniref:condensation domain-containing protein n=1 Tax=Streptomyces sp. NPDC059071 TaxID=3346714 RepID=UPI0036A886A9
AVIKAAKEQLRAVPGEGAGFGILRYLYADGVLALMDAPTPQIGFTYRDRAVAGAESPRWQHEPLNAVLSLDVVRLDTGLEVEWRYASRLLSAADIGELDRLWAEALHAFTDHAADPAAGGHTPSDFDLLPVTQSDIDGWDRAYPNLTEVWPLSPLQYGMYFHTLYDADTADVYTVQSLITLEGDVDAARLHDAARTLVARHDNLRVAFVESADGPRQLVLADAEIAWREIDLTTIEDDDARASELARLLTLDAREHFDLSRPLPLRCTLIRMTADSCRFVLTNHHIVLDGWSGPLLVGELLALYLTAGDPAALPPVPAYRRYLSWLHDQDDAVALAAWTRSLAGIDSPTRVVRSPAGIE